MKISEAFEQHEEIDIDYVFECQCPRCRKAFESIDEEYSFCGNRDDFVGDWTRSYGVMDLDDEVEQVDGNHFAIYRQSPDDVELCPECERADEEERQQEEQRVKKIEELRQDFDQLMRMIGAKSIGLQICRLESDNPDTRRYYRKGAKSMLQVFTDDYDFVEQVMAVFDAVYEEYDAAHEGSADE